jgi:hypothetical protein
MMEKTLVSNPLAEASVRELYGELKRRSCVFLAVAWREVEGKNLDTDFITKGPPEAVVFLKEVASARVGEMCKQLKNPMKPAELSDGFDCIGSVES